MPPVDALIRTPETVAWLELKKSPNYAQAFNERVNELCSSAMALDAKLEDYPHDWRYLRQAIQDDAPPKLEKNTRPHTGHCPLVMPDEKAQELEREQELLCKDAYALADYMRTVHSLWERSCQPGSKHPQARSADAETASERRIRERQRKARELHEQGLTNSEIAAQLDVHESTVSRDLRQPPT